MRLLDTSAIDFILKSKLSLDGEYFITPDIEQEISIGEASLKVKMPKNIKNILGMRDFNECLYLRNYFEMLNKHRGRSFFSMSGFGDISLIALAKTLLEDGRQKTLPIPGLASKIEIFSDDEKLLKRINGEADNRVILRKSEELRRYKKEV